MIPGAEAMSIEVIGDEFWQLSWDERHNAASKEGIALLFDKPKEYTSARIVNIVKKFLNVNKAGHSGTLDPKATGLMVVCTGKKTKSLNELLGCDKEYEGIMVIGERTKSYDTETEVFEKSDISHITDEKIAAAVKELTGEISQVPPMFSAVKHKGKPLYKMARKGETMERAPKQVNIKVFEVGPLSGGELAFRVHCSKGTYIRSLASDLGDKLGVGAYLKELRRTKIGDLDIKNALGTEDFINRNRK
ncbi:MAG TPA: tRNA pseudouridine(55) synthase TruB [Ignavibacteria bacterium]|nr:tRNA pseudouridine(55) synthase TruB [Ignavibacteria bacterium]